jgi:hypothetical protein
MQWRQASMLVHGLATCVPVGIIPLRNVAIVRTLFTEPDHDHGDDPGHDDDERDRDFSP